MTPFPIFGTPFLVWSAILNKMNFKEIVTLAECSRKTYKMSKAAYRKRDIIDILSGCPIKRTPLNILQYLRFLSPLVGPVTLTISITDPVEFIISIRHSSKIYDFKVIFAIPIPRTCRVISCGQWKMLGRLSDDDMTVTTYWNNRRYGIIQFLDYLEASREDLNLKIENLELNRDVLFEDFPEIMKLTTNWIHSKKVEVQNLRLMEKLNQKDFEHLFYRIQPTVSFVSNAKTTPGFRDSQHGQFKMRRLALCPGNWFTFENLMDCDCETIDISSCQFDERNILEFLKQWREGKRWENLKKLALVLSHGVIVEKILKVLQKERSPLRIQVDDMFSYIEHKDGAVARITSRDGNLQLTHLLTIDVLPQSSHQW
ncbi:hypothetical protein CRE_05861 [Caenorhabditis remanei]|uniref:Sdz-33 F-box domain-containing protein n=1 Tax=Caenorhabditis remanei TaxID=31234 RepID=E3MNR8_CAERE|nr:hypothetical protein CRE_05861 [Caenorhabditis remanei]